MPRRVHDGRRGRGRRVRVQGDTGLSCDATQLIGRQATLWPDWRRFAFLTNLGGDQARSQCLPPFPRPIKLAHQGPEGRYYGINPEPSGQLQRQMPPGSSVPLSLTTSSPVSRTPSSGNSRPRTSSSWLEPSAPGATPSPAASSIAPAGPRCQHPSNGPGRRQLGRSSLSPALTPAQFPVPARTTTAGAPKTTTGQH